MTIMRDIGSPLAVLGLVVASRLADSPLAIGMRYSALIYLSVDLLLQARAGYLRRRPHWTPESWRRYFIACSVPVGALLVVAGVLVAVDWRLPIVGQAGSTTRGVWVLVLIFSLFVGAGGLAVVLGWLTRGEATQQFAGLAWFRRRGGEAA
jgi:hypothetical protein